MEVKIGKEKVTFFSKVKGSNKNKFNRVAKLAVQFNELDNKLDGMIERGNFETETARCALAVKLMLHTGIRVGNEGSAEGYMTKPHPYSKEKPKFVKTYGLTTLLHEHLVFKNNKARFMFVGKKQVDNYFEVGGTLHEYLVTFRKSRPKNEPLFGIDYYTLKKFIQRYVGKQFTPKDFRTLRANIEAWHAFKEIKKRELPETKKEFKSEVSEIVGHVANLLNNTPAVCKRNYIDDLLFQFHQEKRAK